MCPRSNSTRAVDYSRVPDSNKAVWDNRSKPQRHRQPPQLRPPPQRHQPRRRAGKRHQQQRWSPRTLRGRRFRHMGRGRRHHRWVRALQPHRLALGRPRVRVLRHHPLGRDKRRRRAVLLRLPSRGNSSPTQGCWAMPSQSEKTSHKQKRIVLNSQTCGLSSPESERASDHVQALENFTLNRCGPSGPCRFASVSRRERQWAPRHKLPPDIQTKVMHCRTGSAS